MIRTVSALRSAIVTMIVNAAMKKITPAIGLMSMTTETARVIVGNMRTHQHTRRVSMNA